MQKYFYGLWQPTIIKHMTCTCILYTNISAFNFCLFSFRGSPSPWKYFTTNISLITVRVRTYITMPKAIFTHAQTPWTNHLSRRKSNTVFIICRLNVLIKTSYKMNCDHQEKKIDVHTKNVWAVESWICDCFPMCDCAVPPVGAWANHRTPQQWTAESFLMWRTLGEPSVRKLA